MASSRSIPTRSLASTEHRHRRSSFNGAKQLSAAQAPARRILVLLALLALALVAALAVIVGSHLQNPAEQPPSMPAEALVTHPGVGR